MVVNLIL